MPTNLLAADSGFPTLSDSQSTDEKFRVVTNYLYMLLEQLRYTMSNLGAENFNKTELENIGNYFTEPLYTHLEDTDGNVSALAVQANQLNSRITNVSGDLSELTQTVEGFRLSASSGTKSSTLTLSSNGVDISSASISFSGMVTFSDLEGSGKSTINGDNITTGTISAVTYRQIFAASGEYGGGMECYYQSERYLAGGLRFDDEGAGTSSEAKYRLFLYTKTIGTNKVALKLESAGGISLSAAEGIYLMADGGISAAAGGTVSISASSIELSSPVYIGGEDISTKISSLSSSVSSLSSSLSSINTSISNINKQITYLQESDGYLSQRITALGG